MINFTGNLFLNKISSAGLTFKGTNGVSRPDSKADVFVKSAPDKKLPNYVSKEEITPELLESLSKALYSEGKKDFEKYLNLFETAFEETGAKLTGRTKEPSSILPKLAKRKELLDCSDPFGPTLTERAQSAVPDLNGYRLITSGKPEEIEKIVSKITDLIDSGKLYPSHFFNYGQIPYLTEDETDLLSKYGFYHNKNKKPSGFSCVNMYFYTNEGKRVELQIIGDGVNKVNDRQHLMYNYKTKGAASEHGVINEPVQKIFDSMTPDEMKEYEKYENDCYIYARLKEQGISPEKPKLPEGLNKALVLI